MYRYCTLCCSHFLTKSQRSFYGQHSLIVQKRLSRSHEGFDFQYLYNNSCYIEFFWKFISGKNKSRNLYSLLSEGIYTSIFLTIVYNCSLYSTHFFSSWFCWQSWTKFVRFNKNFKSWKAFFISTNELSQPMFKSLECWKCNPFKCWCYAQVICKLTK